MNCVLKRALSASIICSGAYALYTYVNSETIVRTDYSLCIDKVTKEYKILLISDVHYGTAQRTEVFDSVIGEFNSVNADLVVLAGDIVQSGRTSYSDMVKAFKLLGSIDSKYGIYFVTGNHDLVIDYGFNNRDPLYTEYDLHKALANSGIVSINDIYVVLDELLLIGRSDRVVYEDCIRPAIGEYPEGYYTILVDHKPCEPDSIDLKCDLRLSGHTHAGQVFPINLYFAVTGGYRYGKHLLQDGSTLIVSSGAGVGRFPLRNLGHCEYVVITIKPITKGGK